MSTATLSEESTVQIPPIDPAGESIPLARLVHLEVRKMLDTRAGMWLLIVMAGIGFLMAAGQVRWGGDGTQTFASFLDFIVLPLILLLPVMGIMSATQEWGHRTGLVTFTLVPKRGRMIAAKVGAAIVLTVVLLLAGGLAAAAATLISGGEFSLTGLSLGGLVLGAMIFTLQGFAFGSAFLNTPLAIVVTLLLPNVWLIVTAIISQLSDVQPWLDLRVAAGPLNTGTMTGENWAQLATTSAVWVVLPLLIGSYRILTREVK